MPVTLAAFSLSAASAVSQDRDPGVDQLTAPSAGRMEQLGQSTSPGTSVQPNSGERGAGPAAAASQISSGAANAGQAQLSAAGPSDPSAQLSRADPSARVAAVPPGLRDACEEAAAGRRFAPQGVDCSVVLEAVMAVERPSAEEALLLGDGLAAGPQQAAPTGQSQSFDANDVARRLATGDVQNAPLAQAVAASLSSAPTPRPEPSTNPVVILPGRSDGVPQPRGN